MGEIVRAKGSYRHGTTFVKGGDLFDSDDPTVQANPDGFEAVAGAVRTTATVPRQVTEPPPAKKAAKRATAKKTED